MPPRPFVGDRASTRQREPLTPKADAETIRGRVVVCSSTAHPCHLAKAGLWGSAPRSLDAVRCYIRIRGRDRGASSISAVARGVILGASTGAGAGGGVVSGVESMDDFKNAVGYHTFDR